MQNAHSSYRSATIQTSDKGKILVMVYDYCIQHCDRAIEAASAGQLEPRNRAITKVQDGLVELTCALDMEAGGEVAKNLWRLYDYMSWTLSECLMRRQDVGIKDVRGMMADLRSAWQVAAEEVRKTQPSTVTSPARTLALVG